MKLPKQINILGLSEFSVSMLFEIIHHAFPKNVEIQIIQNLPYEAAFPFATPQSNYSLISHKEADFNSLQNFSLGVFGTNAKKTIYDYFNEHGNVATADYINLIYPNAVIASTVTLGTGIHINPSVVIAPHTNIGDFVSINRNVSIGHHSHISDFCTFNPASNIAGKCHLGKGVTLGMGANVVDGVHIGENTVVGAGSLVTKNLPANVVAYGVPAKVVRSLSNFE